MGEIAQNPTNHGPMMGGSRTGKTGFGLRDGFLKAGASGCEGKQERKGKESGAALVACLSMEQYHNWLLQSTLGGRQKKQKQKQSSQNLGSRNA